MLIQKRGELFTIRLTVNNESVSHIHKDVEIFYLLEGRIRSVIGNQECILQPGMVSCVFPYQLHSTETIQPSKAIMLIVSPDILTDFHKEFAGMLPATPFLETGDKTKEIGEILTQILACKEAGKELRLIKGYLYILFSKCLEQFSFVTKDMVKDSLYEEIMEYMNQNFKEPLTLSMLATHLGYNKYYLSHLFQANLHTSFKEMLRKVRCEYAIGLLTHSDFSITDVCYESGFTSIRSFYRAFEELYQATPGDFRHLS